MKIGINGTGLTARALVKLVSQVEEFKELEIGQINGRSMTIDILKDRLLYSSSQGHSKMIIDIDKEKNELIINGKRVKYSQDTAPENIKWSEDIILVIEATGKFKDSSKESSDPNRHFKTSNNKIKCVLVSAPGKGGIKDYMWYASPNLESDLKILTEKKEPFVISGASCTTTATIPIIDTLDEVFGVESCFLTTIHAVTRSQDILDGSEGWSALDTQIHTTGATSATNKVLKKNIPMDGVAYRTTDKDGSFIQIDAVLKKNVSKEDLILAFKNSKYSPYITYSDVKLPPSSYIRGNHSMVLLLPDEFTIVNNNRVIIKGLYDNEEGYAAHLLRLVKYLMKII
ncbi:MAG: hypothetical protein JXA54_02190 [Candidatus Heimdallarchaeota archaeon]|nr:hypothetical protein [Candidatus Heimdallarchaeota archaeon]